jgi:hypothetical protein
MRRTSPSSVHACLSAVVLGGAASAPAMLSAQAHGPLPRFELEPFAGVFVPTADQIATPAVDAGVPGAPAGARLASRQRASAQFGLGLTWRPTARVGAELWFAQANSQVENRITAPGAGPVSERGSARVLTTALLARLALPAPTTAALTWDVGAGPAQVFRAGDAYTGLPGVRDFGVAFQVAARYAATRHVALRLAARDLVYRASFGEGAGGTPARTQNDLGVTLGVSLSP